MLRSVTVVTAMGIVLCALAPANAAPYCAKYVGGPERIESGDRSQCNFATLKECRASVRARGGGTCYNKAKLQ
jgi:hypothetical protein